MNAFGNNSALPMKAQPAVFEFPTLGADHRHEPALEEFGQAGAFEVNRAGKHEKKEEGHKSAEPAENPPRDSAFAAGHIT
jgi:hypothetical protein